MSLHNTRLEVIPRNFQPRSYQQNAFFELFNVYHLSSTLKLDQDKLAEVFVDPVTHQGIYQQEQRPDFKFNRSQPLFVSEVSFRPGVTDNSGFSAESGLKTVGLDGRVASRFLCLYWGEWNESLVNECLTDQGMNPLIQEIKVYSYQDFKSLKLFEQPHFPKVELDTMVNDIEKISMAQELDVLDKLSVDRCLALNRDELIFLQSYFSKPETIKLRQQAGLQAELTDVELEIIAQSWSEHCKHKIFAADISYTEESDVARAIGAKEIKGLYPTYIKKVTKEMQHDWLISVFSDNAGIVRFDSKLDACIKVETHNSPSALDPYGGALTGILGVNRDIMGTGIGARPVANMDVFCFGPPEWPLAGQEDLMPQGLMRPKRLLHGVHRGVEDGGNKSGIPTVNGAIHFDPDYAGKPLVFVGTVGLMPQKLPSGLLTSEKRTQVGDKIVVIGGAIGADGIHGATFSSLELDENAPATAVQIGDPLTQKRVMDLLLEARDLELYTGITDNGAGGLSSSLGEMATLTGGAVLDLAKNPTKYPGLKAFELMISESQERMSLSVAPDKCQAFVDLCARRGVSVSVLGEFTDSGFFDVHYHQQRVAYLDLHFLHKALPAMKLKAHWPGEYSRQEWMPKIKKANLEDHSIKQVLLDLLNSPNIASKESLVRHYDHEVQGATIVKPFMGEAGHGPMDAGAIWLGIHGGDEKGALVISNGLAPRLSLVDPYLMAIAAVDEAVRNAVVTGANPEQLCLLDNFCWPDPVQSKKNPDGEVKLAALVRTCEGLATICRAYQAPLVSGKDSMKNDFRGKNKKGEPIVISILPTLLVTAMGRAEIDSLVTTPFKNSGDKVALLGPEVCSLESSELAHLFECRADQKLELPDLKNLKKNYQDYHQLASAQKIQSGHDLSDGGLLVSLSECLIGSDASFGLDLCLDQLDWNTLFGEGFGRIVISFKPEDEAEVTKTFSTKQFKIIGTVTKTSVMNLEYQGTHLSWNRDELVNAFCGRSW
jgi:phosphoribosylformylglycinamidine synthase subunit PurSL